MKVQIGQKKEHEKHTSLKLERTQLQSMNTRVPTVAVATLLAVGAVACGPSAEEVAQEKACTAAETEIKELAKGYETETMKVIKFKRELDADEQAGNFLGYREKTSQMFALMTEVKEDLMIPYSEAREAYGDSCTDDERREKFQQTFIEPFQQRMMKHLNKLTS